MRIAMLTWEFPPRIAGGMGRHVADLAPALAAQKAEVHVITPVDRPDQASVTSENCVTVHRVYAQALNDIENIYAQARQVNQTLDTYLREQANRFGPFHLLHTHDWLTGFAAQALQQAWNIPLVVTIHATERGRNRGFLTGDLQKAIDQAEQTLTRQAQQVIVCSQFMAQEVQYFFGLPADRITVIPNGVDIRRLQNGWLPDELMEFRRQYAAPDEALVFSISRLVYEKGVHLLVEAAPAILADQPRTRIVIAGLGPEYDRLTARARELGLNDRLNFIGYISDEERNRLFRVANCAVFPSLYEPFGIVALEAMALGCPLVVSNVGGFSEVVAHEQTGLKIYPDNVESTAWGVLQALNHPDRVQQYARHARQIVAQQYSWARIAAMTIDAYRRVLLPEAI